MSDPTPQPELDDDFDEAQRELCADGACTGVIGDDRKCKACGRPAGEPAAPGEPLTLQRDQPDFLADRGDHVFEDDDRRLCPDGACIGVLNSQGICKVCGKSASS